MSILWSAVIASPKALGSGSASPLGAVEDRQGALVGLFLRQISQFGSLGKCVKRLCSADGSTMDRRLAFLLARTLSLLMFDLDLGVGGGGTCVSSNISPAASIGCSASPAGTSPTG